MCESVCVRDLFRDGVTAGVDDVADRWCVSVSVYT